MSWVRLDDRFTEHPKVAALTDVEFRVWMRVLCYCGRLQDPSIDDVTLREVAGLSKARLERLIAARLVDKTDGGHEVHDWPKYQPKDATGAERQAEWRARKSVTNSVTQSVTDTVTSPSRAFVPVPVPENNTDDEEGFPGWNPRQRDAALADPERARAWLTKAGTDLSVTNPAAWAWSMFMAGGWPSEKPQPKEDKRVDPASVFKCCGEKFGQGHADGCASNPATLPELELPADPVAA